MAIVGRAKYTRARPKFRGDATRRERRKITIAKLRDYSQSIQLVTAQYRARAHRSCYTCSFLSRFLKRLKKVKLDIACFRRSDSGARAKTKASERAGKNEGRLGKRSSSPVSPRNLPLFRSLYFSRLPRVFYFPLFRSLYFSLALHYLNAWNRLSWIINLLWHVSV